MTEKKQRLCDLLIKNFGFEDEDVIWFCQVVEDKRFDDVMTTYAYYKVLRNKGVVLNV